MRCENCGAEMQFGAIRTPHHPVSECISNLKRDRDALLEVLEPFLVAARNGVLPREQFVRNGEAVWHGINP